MLKKYFLNKLRQKHPDNFNKYDYSLVPNEFHNKIKIPIICPIHGRFEQIPSSQLLGNGCLKCSIRNKYNIKQLVKKFRKIHGYKYRYKKKYINNKIKIPIICPTHGEFEQRPDSHLAGAGCPRCKESSGEKHISSILDKLNIQYHREYRILPHRYFYDFYLPEYNIYIEYHGIQHYIPLDYFGGKRTLDECVKRDNTKIELIERSSGILIIIKYTFKTKEQIEDELLRLFSIIHSQFLQNKELDKQMIINSNVYLIQDGISYIRK